MKSLLGKKEEKIKVPKVIKIEEAPLKELERFKIREPMQVDMESQGRLRMRRI
jgi:hypothetical protein